MALTPLAVTPLQLGGVLADPLGQVLLVLVAIAVVILVGRLVTIAAVIIAALLLLSFFGINVV